MKQLTELYTAIITSLGLPISDTGNIMMEALDGPSPLLIGGRKVIVPTTETLRAFNADHQMIFHPMSESVVRSQSPMIKKLRMLTMYRLQGAICVLLPELMAIAADSSLHAKLPPAAAEMLRAVPDVDAKTVQTMEDIAGAANGDDKKIISFYLRQGGVINGMTCQRATIVTFPFLKEFDRTDGLIFGVPTRKKDRVAIKALFMMMFPNCEDTDTYSFGSNSSTAPYFHALINAYVKIGKRINEVAKPYRKVLKNDDATVDLDFASDVVDLTKYRDLLPAMSGNDGEIADTGSTAGSRAQIHQQPMAPPPPPMPTQQPQYQQPQPTTYGVLPIPAATMVNAGDQYSNIKPLGATGEAAKVAISATHPARADFNPEVAEWERAVAAANAPPLPFGFNPNAPAMVPMVPMGYPQPVMAMPWLPASAQPQQLQYPQQQYQQYQQPQQFQQPVQPYPQHQQYPQQHPVNYSNQPVNGI